MTAWTDRYWTSRDGLRLHYRDYAGPAERLPILMLHGLTRNARDFEAVAERIAGEWRVIAIDFRGRGLSDPDPRSERYTPTTYAEDVVELLDQLGIDRAIFFGTSLGALVTMAVAAMQPMRLAGALINDIGPEVDPRGIERIRSYVGIPVRFGGWDEAAESLRSKHGDVHPSYGDAEWLRYARRVCRQSGDGGVEFDYDMAIADNFNRPGSDPVGDLWPLFRALGDIPVLVLRGANSDLLDRELAEKMQQALPDVELVTVEGVGHAPDLDEPEAIAGIDRLLDRVQRRERR
ncbi:MAG TPA: alpha/beta hydrolase [Sphingomicrobium sp.]|nr:alpha/beta hydrolase [Sphingomicrobium sp.]